LNREGGKKAGVHELPNQDGGVIQQFGNKTITHKIQAYIYGANYDILADKFFRSLREKGVGVLDHPRWGEIKVVPVSYSQSEKFISGMGVAIIDIQFMEYEHKESIISKEEERSKFLQKLDKFKEAVSLDFLNGVQNKLIKLVEKNIAMQEFSDLLRSFETGLTNIQQTKREVQNQLDVVLRNINRVDGIVKDTKNTIESIITLNFLSIETNDNILNIFNSHKSIQNDYQKVYIPNSNSQNISTALLLQVFYASSIGAMATKALEVEYTTKLEAIQVLDNLYENVESFVHFQDNFQKLFSLNTIDSNYILQSDTYLLLTELISIAYSYILNQLYDLKTEEKIILEKDITPLALSWEIYGTINKLDDIIKENSLGSYELLLLRAGREIKVYR
jgi:prophage DNA circulation protein